MCRPYLFKFYIAMLSICYFLLFLPPSLPPSTILCSEPPANNGQESGLEEEQVLTQGSGIERQATTSVGSEESIPFASPSDSYLEKVKSACM